MKKSNRSFGSLTFADKKKELPLQAADMVAYRFRQISQNFVDDTVRANWPDFEEALFKPMFSAFDSNPSLFKKAMKCSVLHKAALNHFKKRP